MYYDNETLNISAIQEAGRKSIKKDKDGEHF